ncbi:MAG TPA: MMPL family transporter [Pirellulales bacterium]|nr:MMPL family transporter [Pirellulales bacterium]
MTKRDFYARHSPAILLIAVFLLPISFAGARRALNSNQNRVEQWLPDQYEETQVYQEFRKHFQGEEFVLVSWDGCTLDDERLALLSRKLVPEEGDEVPAEARYFTKALSGPAIIDTLTKPPINITHSEAVERLRGSLIGQDGKQTCLVLTLSPEGKKSLRKTIGKIYNTAEKECNIKHDALHMGGPPSDNVAIDLAGEQSLVRLASLAGFIGLAISWWCLRSVKLVAIVLSAGVYSAMASLAFVWYSGGEMNAIVLTMPSLVYVAAISGAIHLANYYRDSIHEGGLEGAPMRAIKHAWLPLSLATGTTAVGLLTLCYSELVPIQLFGFYSAVGVVFSLLFLFFFMPAAFERWPLTDEASGEAQGPAIDPAFFGNWGKVGDWIIGHNGIMTAAGLAVIGFCALGMYRMETSVQLMRLFSPKAKVVTDYEWLEEHLGNLIPMEVVINIDPLTARLNFLERMELVQRVQKEVETIPEVGKSLSAATFSANLGQIDQPDVPKPKKRRGLRDIVGSVAGVRDEKKLAADVRNKKLEEHRDEYLNSDYLREKDGREMWRVSARVSALKNVDYAKFVADIKAKVEPVLDDMRAKLGPDSAAGLEATYTGLVPLVYKAQNSLLDGLVTGFITDLILIFVAIVVAMRSFTSGIILAVPSVFPPIVVFGLMGWLGIVIDIGTVMTPSVALGVSVDDIVHFMLQYRRAIAAGATQREAVKAAYHHCGRAMYQSWGVIGLGLSVFALSPFTPTQRFGCMTIALLTATLLANLLILPAILAGPLGTLFARGARKKKPTAAEEPPRQTPPAPKSLRPLDESPRIEPTRRPVSSN